MRIARAIMGKLWRVDKALEDSEGLRWVRKQLEPYEWSKVDWITVRRGWSEVSAFRGVCKLPSKGRGYRVNCSVSKHTTYPISQSLRVSPLYRNQDGTWPEVPEGYKVGGWYVSPRNGKSVHWKGLYRPLELKSEDEVWCSWWRMKRSTICARRGRCRGGTER